MASEEGDSNFGSLLNQINHFCGYKRILENWQNISILVFFPILGFSIMAGFFAGQEAFFECFFGALLIALALGSFSVMITFINERYKGDDEKAGMLRKKLQDLDAVLNPLQKTIQQFESRLTELMASLPKEAAVTYQKAKSLSVASVKRKETLLGFAEKEGSVGIEAALELFKLPIDLKYDALNSVSTENMVSSINAEEWHSTIKKFNTELQQFLRKP